MNIPHSKCIFIGYNVTRYFYNESNGKLLAQINPDGNGVSYQYDGMGNMTEVLPATVWDDYDGYSSVSGSSKVSYGYDSTTKRLSTITTRSSSSSGTTYYFEYDKFGNSSEVSVGNRTLASYAYNANNGKLSTLTYGNGLAVKYVYDKLDRISEIQYNIGDEGAFVAKYSYTYDSAGNIYSVTDERTGTVTMYRYDASGKPISSYVYDDSSYESEYGTSLWYDEQSRVYHTVHRYDYYVSGSWRSDTSHYYYDYNDTTGNLSKLTYYGANVEGTITPYYDNFGRLTDKSIAFRVDGYSSFYNSIRYYYKSNGNFQSGLVSSYESEIYFGTEDSPAKSATWNYEYDANGNITEIKNSSGTVQYKYTYDSLGQLTREDNRPFGKSYVWTYDSAGNILSKKTYAFTTGSLGSVQDTESYTYGDSSWKDLLTSYDGQSVSYDAIGNPTSYGGRTLTWQGRELIRLYDSVNGMDTSFKYNADGIRTIKVHVDDLWSEIVFHYYDLDGSQILREYIAREMVDPCTLVYIYDEAGSPIGYRFREISDAYGVFETFFYEKNLQGDIVAVYSDDGTLLVSYSYDAWGNHTLTYHNGGEDTGAFYNPFRYRGYYYDAETGLYYLNSRYYDPETGRFINADRHISTGQHIYSYNMFAYCIDNPIMYVDSTGDIGIGVLLGTAALILCILSIPSSQNQYPLRMQEAQQKYNNETVNVYFRGDGEPDKNKLNAEFHIANEDTGYVNISIDRSLDVDSSYEMDAVLAVIVNSEYYSEDEFGSVEYMKAQWVAHNWCHSIASSGKLGYAIMQVASGSENPIDSSVVLDIRCKENMLLRQKVLYTIISWFI